MVRDFLVPSPDLNGKTILITGGTGSFGKHFSHAVLKRFQAKKIIIFSRDEHKQVEMMPDFNEVEMDIMRFFIGDVRDEQRLDMAMNGVDVVIHAAALKHVPVAEYNPFECINTNVMGAENVVRAALRNNVPRVMALSTDKAVNPVNLYGASKLAADKIFVAANHLSGNRLTRFSVVRYGNVVGSRGSVVPLFRKLIREGATSLPITDPRMTRFWITLEQGVNFVLSSLAMMQGWEIFVPKIPSMRVTDLAASMGAGLPHKVVGIRPGEKLHELLLTEDDARGTLELEDRYLVLPASAVPEMEQYKQRGAKQVPESFRYASDTNDEWASADLINSWLSDET
ncbi:MAG: UDP-N-acetylglucosamine 4,6-dehydratase (inverting) [Alphaproteobacteria bacterium]|nr:UDP-N-acetylglucosamine 4,6-dehydratase (inverting) [Alphaproteobacteria bacterium]